MHVNRELLSAVGYTTSHAGPQESDAVGQLFVPVETKLECRKTPNSPYQI